MRTYFQVPDDSPILRSPVDFPHRRDLQISAVDSPGPKSIHLSIQCRTALNFVSHFRVQSKSRSGAKTVGTTLVFCLQIPYNSTGPNQGVCSCGISWLNGSTFLRQYRGGLRVKRQTIRLNNSHSGWRWWCQAAVEDHSHTHSSIRVLFVRLLGAVADHKRTLESSPSWALGIHRRRVLRVW